MMMRAFLGWGLFTVAVLAGAVLQPATAHAQALLVGNSSVAMSEIGGSSTYAQTVWLSSGPTPTSNVTVEVGVTDATVVTVNPTMLTFTPQNYNVAQEVTYTAVDDSLYSPDHRRTTITFTASGGNYEGVSSTTTVTVWDDEPAPFTADEGVTESHNFKVTVGQGCTPAVLHLTSSDPSLLTISPASLSWGESDSGTGKPASFTFHDDDVVGDRQVTVVRTLHDPPCEPLVVRDWIFTIRDNDGDNTEQVMGVGVAPGNAQLVVTWTAVDIATGYTVQWKSGGEDYNTGDRQATVTPGSTTSHTIPSLTNGTEYTVRVTATGTGAGPPSAEVTGTPAVSTPTASDGRVTARENQDYTFTAADFNYADSNVNPLASVTIKVRPTRAP